MSASEPSRVQRLLRATEFRAVAGGVAVLAVSWTARSTALLAPAAALLALSTALVARPSLRRHWAFNVAFAVGLGCYGAVYALTVTGALGPAVGVPLVALAALMAGNHLGVVPWSDHPRQI